MLQYEELSQRKRVRTVGNPTCLITSIAVETPIAKPFPVYQPLSYPRCFTLILSFVSTVAMMWSVQCLSA